MPRSLVTMRIGFMVLLYILMSVCMTLTNSYGPMGHQVREALEELRRQRFNGFGGLQYDLPGEKAMRPQPQVFCDATRCTYSFTVSAENQVVGQCNDSLLDIYHKVQDLSSKVDAMLGILTEGAPRSELSILQDKVANLEGKLQTEQHSKDQLKLQLTDQHNAINSLETQCWNRTIKTVARDCQDVYNTVSRARGIYKIRLQASGTQLNVYCEDGWTVFQRREDGSVDFDRSWHEYKNGFGHLATEFWLGNKYLHELTSQKPYKLLVELGDWEGNTAHAIYKSFRVDNETRDFKLHIGRFVTGKARDGLRFHEDLGHGGSINGMPFSTQDRDNDNSPSNCAQLYNGGWWYNACFWANLNGEYVYNGRYRADKFTWFTWKKNQYSLKRSKMMLKPMSV